METRKFVSGYAKLKKKRVELFVESQKGIWINL